jgi:hypothetical protein
MRIRHTLALLLLVTGSTAFAAPPKPSKLVNLIVGPSVPGSGAACTCVGPGRLLDTVVAPDGSLSLLELSDKQALVLDGWAWDVFVNAAGPAGANVFASLCAGPIVLWFGAGVSDGSAAAGGGPLPNLVMRPEAPFCMGSGYGNALGTVHATIVRDN